MGGVGREAGSVTGDAVDVRDRAAALTHDVMVVVSDPQFVQSGVPCWLDAAGKSRSGDVGEDVVNCLTGGTGQHCCNCSDDAVDATVGVLAKCDDYGLASVSNAQPGFPQHCCGFGEHLCCHVT